MRRLVLATISAYQRYISPYKGFGCAYRVHTGRQSCSVLGFRVVRRYGVIAGLALLQRRMYLCGVAHRRFSPIHTRPHRAQRGDCDVVGHLPCDFNCDTSDGKLCSSMADFAHCCDGCDWPDRKRKRKDQEPYVYIPPKKGTKGEGK